MHAFILAGGFATRLWPLTERRAKPLLPLAGKPLLTWLVEKIPVVDPTHGKGIPITISTNQVFAEDFKKWKSACHAEATRSMADYASPLERPRGDMIEILIEDAGHEDEKLGALGAVAKWMEENNINDDVLLLAGDNYVGFSIAEFLKAYQGHPLLATHDIGDLEQAKRLGTVILEEQDASIHPAVSLDTRHATLCVKEFEEKPQHPRSTLVSTGCSIFPKETLSALLSFAKKHPDNIGGIFEHFLKQGITVHGVVFEEPWFDVGSFESYLEATKALVGARTVRMEGASTSGGRRQGSVVIGARSTVRDSELRNVVLFEDCAVEDCVLQDCVIDHRCELKHVDLTGKMLREGTRLVR